MPEWHQNTRKRTDKKALRFHSLSVVMALQIHVLKSIIYAMEKISGQPGFH